MQRSKPMMLLVCFSIIVHWSSSVHAQLDPTPSVRELSAGVDTRVAQYRDLKFIYDSRISTRSTEKFKVQPLPPEYDTYGRYVASREILKLRGQPDWQNISRLDASWLLLRPGTFGQDKLMDFAVSADSKFYSFKRLRPGMVRTLKNNDGAVLERSYGSSHQHNLFPSFLFQRVNGITIWDLFPSRTIEPKVWEHRLDEFDLVGQVTIDGEIRYQLKCTTGSADEANWVEVDMSGAPDFMIYRQEYFHQSKSAEVHRVQGISRVNGIAYPSKGTFHREPLGQIHEMSYDYQVTFAGPLTESDSQSWIPSWPPNTMVQEPALRKTFVTSVSSPLTRFPQSMRKVVLTLIGALVIVAVFNALWFAWSPQRFEQRLVVFLAGFAVPTAALAFLFDPVLSNLFAWINCVVLLIAIPVRSLFGTTLLRSRNRNASLNDEQSTKNNVLRAGLRDWGTWVFAMICAVVFAMLLELPFRQQLTVTISVGFIALALIVFIHRWLSQSLFWPVSITTVGAILLWMFLQVPITSLFEFPYFDRDHVAWVSTFVVGFLLLLSMLYMLRIAGYRIGSDKAVVKNLPDERYQLGLREIIVWVSAMAILLAIGQLLSRSNYEGF